MSLSTIFAFTCASTIVFGNPLVNRLNVNDSESLSSEFDAERRRLITYDGNKYYNYPSCAYNQIDRCTYVGSDGRCPHDSYEMCHQRTGAVYNVGGDKCYMALTSCMGCLLRQYRDVRTDALKPVDCAKYRWHGALVGQYGHWLADERQFIYKICVRSGSLIDAIQFWYKTPTDDSYSDFTLTRSRWYGGSGGAERCFEAKDYINQVYTKSAFSINALMFNGKSDARFGGNGGDFEEQFNGGVLRSVEVYYGVNPIIGYNVVNAIKFNWMDGDTANYMLSTMCYNHQIDC